MNITFECGDMRLRNKRRKLDAKLSQRDAKEVYNSISNIYDMWGILAESRARNRALELAEIKDGQSILEVAVGTGIAFEEIIKRNPTGKNIGIDISEGMLEKAKHRLWRMKSNNFELKLASAFEIPYPNGTFDVLINNYMFDLIPFGNMNKIISEFRRVLKIGGTFVLVNMTEGLSFGSKIYDLIYTISPKLFGGCRPVKMTEKLVGGGFEVLNREYIEQLFFPSEVILAKKQQNRE